MWRLIPLLFLAGCAAVPPAISYTANGISLGVWIGSGKSPTDHLLSFATEQDCDTMNVLRGEYVCQNYEEEDDE